MATRTAFHDAILAPGDTGAIPLAEIVPWAMLALLLATIFLYFVSTEQGAVSLFDGMVVHEFVHDGRHLLGFPCH